MPVRFIIALTHVMSSCVAVQLQMKDSSRCVYERLYRNIEGNVSEVQDNSLLCTDSAAIRRTTEAGVIAKKCGK